MKVLIFIFVPLLLFLTWTKPTQKIAVICGAYDVVAIGGMSLVNKASDFASSLGNGGKGVQLGGNEFSEAERMSVACREKVRKTYIMLSDPSGYERVFKNQPKR